MPTYNFRCNSCSARFNVQATIREMEEGNAAKFACPSCHSNATKKVFSIGSFLGNVFARETKGCCEGGSCCGGPKQGEKNCCGGSSSSSCCS
ncbi:MAG: zinc ribbon domain-containing protein [Candidatus Peribacteraceae bacterium]|nr:zinc ribbon domain-containing protein [Candidatus Peribacteraceae bacterium]